MQADAEHSGRQTKRHHELKRAHGQSTRPSGVPRRDHEAQSKQRQRYPLEHRLEMPQKEQLAQGANESRRKRDEQELSNTSQRDWLA